MRDTLTRAIASAHPAGLAGLLVAAVLLSLPAAVEGQARVPSVVPAYASVPPTIDGSPTEGIWRTAAPLRDFWLSDEDRRAPDPTEVRVLRDGTTLFVAFSCIGDPPNGAGRVPALEDHVTVEVDPGGNQAYRTFTVNRDGEQFENGIASAGGGAPWRGAAAENDGGWSAEMAIPVMLLAQDGRLRDPMIDFIRYRAQTREWSRWADRSAPGFPSMAGRLQLSAPSQAMAPQPPVPPSAPPLPPPAVVQSQPLGTATTNQWAMPPMPPADSTRPPGFAPAPQPVPVSSAETTAMPLDASGYVLQLGDVLEIKHFHNPELNELLPIRPDGRISLELVGEVQAAGLPVSDLRAILMQRYAKYVREPEVAIIVKEFGGNRVFIGGEVTQPGVLQTNGQLTVLQAIFQAGGYLPSAELRNVVVLRNQGTATPAFLTFDLKESLTKPGEHMNDALLRPYDIVFLPKTRVARMGEFVDQYIDELIPLPVTLGLSYLFR